MARSHISPIADESVATGGLMPLVSIRKHFKLGICLFLAISLLGFPLAWKKGKSIYSATATIYIAPRVANILQENKEQDYSTYQDYKQFIEQQESTIRRYDIMLLAIKKLSDKYHIIWANPKESDRLAAERLQSALVIKQVSDIYLISVALESDKAEGLDQIVNTVVESYIETWSKEQSILASKDRVELLNQQRDKLHSFITENKKRLAEISQDLGVTTFVEGANSYDKLLDDTQFAYSVAQRNRMEAEANLLLFDNPKDPKAPAAFDAFVSDIVYKDQGLNSLKGNLYLRRSELVKLISGLDPKHPGYAQIKSQLQVIETDVVEATNQLTKDVKHMILEERRSKVTMTRKIEQDLLEQITKQKKDAAWFSGNYNEALTLNQDIKRYYSQLESVENRIGFFELESKAPSIIRMETAARSPEFPIGGGRKKLLIIVMVLAIVAGLAVPIVIDMLDKRIKTVGQVEKMLGYKPLAALLDSGQNEVSQSAIVDKIRRLALALDRARKQSGKPSNLILITSVNPQSAVTSLVLDLVRDYEKIGMRAVAVEVNLLKPDNRYVSENTEYGLINLLQDPNLEVLKAVSPANNKYPDRISIGLTSEALLFEYQRLQMVLEKIAEIYSVVILDTPPILFSADVEFLTSISNIALLVIAAQQTKPGEIKRAVTLLERIDPEAIGFVVTRLQVFKGGGYYSIFNKVSSKPSQTNINFFTKYFKKNDNKQE
jgi:Mrp family chromosome partitioning ATPase